MFGRYPQPSNLTANACPSDPVTRHPSPVTKSMLSLELLDSGLVLAQRRGRDVEIIDEAPGMAVLEEQQTITGVEARKRVRRQPLLAQSNYWRALSTAPLTRPSRLI